MKPRAQSFMTKADVLDLLVECADDKEFCRRIWRTLSKLTIDQNLGRELAEKKEVAAMSRWQRWWWALGEPDYGRSKLRAWGLR